MYGHTFGHVLAYVALCGCMITPKSNLKHIFPKSTKAQVYIINMIGVTLFNIMCSDSHEKSLAYVHVERCTGVHPLCFTIPFLPLYYVFMEGFRGLQEFMHIHTPS